MLIVVALVCLSGSLRAQSKDLVAAWGVNGGHNISPTSNGFQLEAFYDIPIGHVFFSPGIKVMFSPNAMFSVDTRVRFPLVDRLHLGFGGSVMIWEDRASIGVPVELSYPIDVMSRVQLNPGLAVTPHFFLGKERDGIMYSASLGLRFPLL